MIYVSLRMTANDWTGFKVEGVDVDQGLKRVQEAIKTGATFPCLTTSGIFNPGAAPEIIVSDHITRMNEDDYIEIDRPSFTGVTPVSFPG